MPPGTLNAAVPVYARFILFFMDKWSQGKDIYLIEYVRREPLCADSLPGITLTEREHKLSVLKKLSWLWSDLFLFVLVLIPFLYIAGTVLWHGIPDNVTAGDGALLEMSTRDVFSRGILLGPYSRFYFFHPGPLYFIVRYPFYMAMGQRSSSLLIATVMIAASSLFGAWYAVRKLTDKFTSVLFSAVFLLFLMNTDKLLWLSDWNPFIIMIPVILYAVAVAAVGSGNTWFLFLGVLSGSFVAQTHIGGIPALALTSAVTMVCAGYPWITASESNRNSGNRSKHILTGLVLLLVLWAPPIYEELTAEPQGNLTKIREFFEESSSNQNTATAFHAWSGVQASFETDRFLRSLLANGLDDEAFTVVIALRLLFLSLAFSLLRRKGKFGFLCTLNLICLFLHGATYYSVLQIRGELNAYLIEWMKMLAPLSLFAILASITALSGELRLAVRFRKYALPALALFIVYASYSVSTDVRGYFRTDLHPSWEDEIAVRELSSQLGELISLEPDSYYILRLHSGNRWPVMVGLMNTLEKRGYPVCMDDNMFFISTPVPEGARVRILHMGNRDEFTQNLPEPVADYSGIVVVLE